MGNAAVIMAAAYAIPGIAVAAWAYCLLAHDSHDILDGHTWAPLAGTALLAGAMWWWTLRQAVRIAREGRIISGGGL